MKLKKILAAIALCFSFSINTTQAFIENFESLKNTLNIEQLKKVSNFFEEYKQSEDLNKKEILEILEAYLKKLPKIKACTELPIDGNDYRQNLFSAMTDLIQWCILEDCQQEFLSFLVGEVKQCWTRLSLTAQNEIKKYLGLPLTNTDSVPKISPYNETRTNMQKYHGLPALVPPPTSFTVDQEPISTMRGPMDKNPSTPRDFIPEIKEEKSTTTASTNLLYAETPTRDQTSLTRWEKLKTFYVSKNWNTAYHEDVQFKLVFSSPSIYLKKLETIMTRLQLLINTYYGTGGWIDEDRTDIIESHLEELLAEDYKALETAFGENFEPWIPDETIKVPIVNTIPTILITNYIQMFQTIKTDTPEEKRDFLKGFYIAASENTRKLIENLHAVVYFIDTKELTDDFQILLTNIQYCYACMTDQERDYIGGYLFTNNLAAKQQLNDAVTEYHNSNTEIDLENNCPEGETY